MSSAPDAEKPGILVSACLLGWSVRYDGKSVAVSSATALAWATAGRVIPFCPEVAAGSTVPRPAAEIVGGDGDDVLNGHARVVDLAGKDVTSAFLEGARVALNAARASGARAAMLKEGSPSCGSHCIHDGSFSGRLVPGRGVVAALLERNGIALFSEHEAERAAEFVASLQRL